MSSYNNNAELNLSKCMYCGIDFEPRNNRQLCCCREHGRKFAYQQVKEKRISEQGKQHCAKCGVEITGHLTKLYCQDCKRIMWAEKTARNRKKNGYEIKSLTSTCIACGRKYHPKAADRIKYCSRECAFEHLAILSKIAEKQKTAERVEKLVKREIEQHKRKTEQLETKRLAGEARQQRRIKRLSSLVCIECGKVFTGNTINQKLCSDVCKKKSQNRYKEIRKREFRRNGRVDNSITLTALIDRDKGVCHICGCKVDVTDCRNDGETFVAGSMYPSIDHVVPRAKGGTHTWGNVKLAHCVCNSIKSDSLVYSGHDNQMKFAL